MRQAFADGQRMHRWAGGGRRRMHPPTEAVRVAHDDLRPQAVAILHHGRQRLRRVMHRHLRSAAQRSEAAANSLSFL